MKIGDILSVSSLTYDDPDKSWSNLYVNSVTVYNDLEVRGNFKPDNIKIEHLEEGPPNTFLHTNNLNEVVWQPITEATKGQKGDPGSDGTSIKGDVGPKGEPGSSIKGDKGDTGQKGDTGSDGISIKGDIGQKGEPGVSIKGEKGDTGTKGDTGSDGISIKGDTGQKGEPGVSIKGDTGLKGDIGQKGEPGDSIKGEKGDVGIKGDPGSDGVSVKGDPGQKGEPGVSIKGDTGLTGEKGSKGEVGVGQKGEKGDYASVGFLRGINNSTPNLHTPSVTILQFPTLPTNTTGLTYSLGIFTATVSGLYDVSFYGTVSTSANSANIYIYVNNNQVAKTRTLADSLISSPNVFSIKFPASLIIGDTLSIRHDANSGLGSCNLVSGENLLSILRF